MPKITEPMPAELVEALAQERRNAFRRPILRIASWKAFTGATALEHPATVHDISTDGMKLVVDRPCHHHIIVIILRDSAELTYPKLVRVQHCTPERDGQWLLGGMFVKQLREDELAIILA